MVELILSEPTCSDRGDCDDANGIIDILNKLESVIWTLITSEGRSEARLWFCKTISCLNSVTPQAQCKVFLKLLRSKPRKIELAAQLLQMIFEKRPQKVAALIGKKNYLLEKFFEGNPRRILQWFGNFASGGESEHKKGARALSQFAFVNRDICWEELEWKGKHGQSPAVVATKPHYFLDLDVQRTVENFLEYVPEFWSSDELADSVKDGEILLMDTKYFIDCFIDLMYEEDWEEVWEVLSDFLLQESFSSLCHRLLLILEESDLCAFLNLLCKFHALKMELSSVDHPSYWLELLLYMQNGCASMDELLLLNAVINQGRHLLRILCDEEHKEARRKIVELVSEISTTSSVLDSTLVKKCLRTKTAESVRLLALQSWVLQYRLSEECKTPESWESIFISSGINFRNSSGYNLVRTDGFIEESESNVDDFCSNRSKRKKGKHRKKRRRYYDLEDGDQDELVDMGTSGMWQGSLPRAGSWLLSTDGYSSTWDSADLPEHLAKHCFSTWMKWLCSK